MALITCLEHRQIGAVSIQTALPLSHRELEGALTTDRRKFWDLLHAALMPPPPLHPITLSMLVPSPSVHPTSLHSIHPSVR